MAGLIKAPRGTQDVLPNESYKWQYIEKTVRETAELFGFREIRFPTFEHTELFCRGVGDTTDVVQKEMYTFEDKGNRSITLRPEGTAGTVRSVIENGLLNDALPLKVCYLTSCFRYEKPQAGRLREFHQFGMECFGSASPSADAEVISAAAQIFKTLGLRNLRLELNSIGCPDCRQRYHKALKAYFESHSDALCPTCISRLEKNPMRILDCKSPECSMIAKDAPVVTDYICEECATHFEGVKAQLTAMDLSFTVNPKIVRGLDYYTKTVFEFVSDEIGAQGTVCGGGRYDGLVETLGGAPTPALGYAMGLERLLLLLAAQNCDMPQPKSCDVYFATMGEAAQIKAAALISMLRNEGFAAECDLMNRSLKAQMKYANKISAGFTVIIGDNELASNRVNLKNMQTGEQTEVSLGNDLLSKLYDAKLSDVIDAVLESAPQGDDGQLDALLGK